MNWVWVEDTGLINLDKVGQIKKNNVESINWYSIEFYFNNHKAVMTFDSVDKRDKKYNEFGRLLIE